MNSNNILNIDNNESNIEALRHLLAHRAWTEFFMPTLTQSRDAAVEQVLDPSEARKRAYPDDFLRGQISILDKLLEHPKALLEDEDAKRAQEDEESEALKVFGIRAHEGHGPLSHP